MKLSAYLVLVLALCSVHAQNVPAPSAADSLPAFKQDSLKTATIRALEAGRSAMGASPAPTVGNADSLETKLRHRHPLIGLTGSFAFANLSARELFVNHMNADTSASVLQPLDPVAIYFPVGLLGAFPVLPYLDLWLRTESFWNRSSGLSRDHASQSTKEYWYVMQGNLAGVGARYLIPVSLLSVNGQAGLYAAYTRFWSFGPTGLYSSHGSVRAKMNPAGVGSEIQVGFQQDFSKRWTWTGGLAYTTLSFESTSPWTKVIADAPATSANWTLSSLRLCLQGFYQFGTNNSPVSGTKK